VPGARTDGSISASEALCRSAEEGEAGDELEGVDAAAHQVFEREASGSVADGGGDFFGADGGGNGISDCGRRIAEGYRAQSLPCPDVWGLQRFSEIFDRDARLSQNALERLGRDRLVIRDGDASRSALHAMGEPSCRTTAKPSRWKALTISVPERSRGSFTPSPEQDR